MVKGLVLAFFSTVCLSLSVFAQKPAIISVDKTQGGMQEIVTLKGSDFGTNRADLKVFFGAASGEIKEIGNQLLEVRTPAGATYDNISVTNITNGLTGYSASQYSLNFGGQDPLTAASLSTQSDFPATSGLYDLCLCDFNNDTKVDIATASNNSNSLAILQNGSTTGAVTLLPTNFLINVKSVHATCGDLNGDGKPDLAVTEDNADRVVIFRNTGNFTFDVQLLKITGRKLNQASIADLDADGKPELVITDQQTNLIIILPNQSTTSSIAFGTAFTVTVPGAVKMNGLEIKDINGNGLPDIVTSQFQIDPGNIFICDNKSSPGIFNFTDITVLPVTSAVGNIRVGDLDGDSKPDIAATRLIGNDIVFLRNQSTGSQIAFSSPQAVITNALPWGLDFGDLNGDGRLDVVIASINQTSLNVLSNNSTLGTISFEPMLTIPTTFITRHVKIGDIDNDGKPDLAFTSVDNNNVNPIVLSSKVSVMRNKSCFVPAVLPEGPLNICTGFPLQLTSSMGGGVTYDWKKDGTSQVSGPDPFLDITVSGGYTVTAISEGGTCTKTSNTVNVTVSAGSGISPGDPGATSNTPVCTDDALQLHVDDMGATEYRWTGPNGPAGTGLNLTISNFTLEKAGIYVVELIAGGCVAKTDSTTVEGIDNPDFSVTFSGTNLICQGSSKTLTVSPVVTSGFTYQWFEQTLGMLAGQTNATLSATASGNYHVEVISAHPGCSPVETAKVNLIAVAMPVASFTPSADEGCIGQVITFVNQSTVDPQATPSYSWSFGDTHTSTEISPENTYTTASTFQVKLSVSYQGGSCLDEETKSVTITAAPTITISAPDNNFNLCPGDTLRLGVTGDDFTDYEWSTGATTPTILIEEPIEYSVTVTTSGGCILEKSQTISALPGPTVTITANPATTIKVGDEVTLNTGGLTSYLWRPGLSLNDSTIANPTATPLKDIVYTVSGKDADGCRGEASIEIKVVGASPFDLIKPMPYFSPNNDGQYEFWSIRNIESFTECAVTIYNDKGSKVFEAKPYANNWDGTFKGSKLPGGVYYYVIRCDGESKAKTGSITLLK